MEKNVIDTLMAQLFDEVGDVEQADAIASALIKSERHVETIAQLCISTNAYKQASRSIVSLKKSIEKSPPDCRLVTAWNLFMKRFGGERPFEKMQDDVRICMPLIAEYLPGRLSSPTFVGTLAH